MSFIFDSNNSYIFNIDEFIDNNRIHYKKIQASLKDNLEINSSIIIKVIAPAIRSTEDDEEIQHKFFKTLDGQYISLAGDVFIPSPIGNLWTLAGENIEEGDLITKEDLETNRKPCLLMVKG